METFKKIDWKIICAVQWLVRQVELYTPLTLSQVIRGITYLYLVSGLIHQYKLFEQEKNMYTFVFFGFLTMLGASFMLLIEKGTKHSSGEVLNREVETQFGVRMIFLIGDIIFLSDYLKDFFKFLGVCCFIIFWYLICCNSLPPGEKAKRKEEKEIAKMQTQIS